MLLKVKVKVNLLDNFPEGNKLSCRRRDNQVQGDTRETLTKKEVLMVLTMKKRIQNGILQQKKEHVVSQVNNLEQQSITLVVAKQCVMDGTLDDYQDVVHIIDPAMIVLPKLDKSGQQ
uniref:Uncharacterized protein n=1 Tax=Solanum tuberosum TaxID=4113 RepID=M1DVX3_SOLTU